MTIRYALFALSLVAISGAALSQPESSRNATAAEIAGQWQLLALPDALQPGPPNTNPWPAQCQWFSYGSSGQMKSIERFREPCAEMSDAELRDVFREVSAVVSWRYDFSETYRQGVIVIDRTDVEDYREVWDPRIVTTPFTKGGVQFQKGDLMLYLANFQTRKPSWIRNLRRVD